MLWLKKGRSGSLPLRDDSLLLIINPERNIWVLEREHSRRERADIASANTGDDSWFLREFHII